MIQLWVVAFIAGMVIGCIIALGRISRFKTVNLLAIFYIELFRNIPVLIQVIWFYYALPIITGHQMSPFESSALALGLNTSAYCAEIYRSGILSVPKGQWEGASAIGMRYYQIFRRIILPQVFKRMLPAFTNRAIELAKMTSICSIIAVQEVMYQGRLLSATYYRPLEIFTAVAIVYFLVIFPGSLFSNRLEKRFSRYD